MRTLAYDGVERRSGSDRREKRLPLLTWLRYNGQRATARRAADRHRLVAFDRYRPSLLAATLVVLGLSLLDGTLTLILISHGAVELNPVMRYYLEHGPHTFILVKYGLTAGALFIVILAHDAATARYRLCAGILPMFSTFFAAVVIWQIYLLSLI